MTKMKFCSGRVDNIVVTALTGETAGYKHFLLVQICFPRAIVFRIRRSRLLGTGTQDIYSTDSIIRYNMGYTNIK